MFSKTNDKYRARFVYVGLLSILALAFIMRIMALSKYACPPGIDPAGYLNNAHILMYGEDVAGFGLTYPPCFPSLLALFLHFFDEFIVLKIAGVLISVLIGVPFFFLTRKFSNDLIALFCTSLFIFYQTYTMMLGWGYITLYGIFFTVVTLYFLLEALKNPTWKKIVLTGTSLSFIAGFHHLTLLVFMLIIGVFILLVLIFDRKSFNHGAKTVVQCSFVALIFSLPYLPTYLNVVGQLSAATFSVPMSLNERIGISLLQIRNLIGVPLPWYNLEVVLSIFLVISSIFGLFKVENKTFRLLMSSFLLTPIILSLTILATRPARPYLYLYIPILLLFAIFLQNVLNLTIRVRRVKIFRRVIILCCVFLLALNVFSSSIWLLSSVEFYQTVKEGELEAFAWIRNNTNKNDLFVTKDEPRGFEIGWWLEALTGRKSLDPLKNPYVGSAFSREIEEARIASLLFSKNHIIENGRIRVADAFPKYWHACPEISVNVGYYEVALFFSDEAGLEVSEASNPRRIWNLCPIDAESKSMFVNQEEEHVEIVYSYRWENLSRIKFERTTFLRQGASYVDISYKVDLSDYPMEDFDFYVYLVAPVESYSKDGSTVTLYQKDMHGRLFETQICPVETEMAEIELSGLYMTGEIFPKIHYKVKSTHQSFYVKMRVSLGIGVIVDEPVRYHYLPDLIKEYAVDYFFVRNSNGDLRTINWLKNAGYFKLVFKEEEESTSEKVMIFKVLI